MKFHPEEGMIHGLEFMDAELLFQEVDVHGIPYLIPILDLPRVKDKEVHLCRGTLRKALELEKILQGRHDSA